MRTYIDRVKFNGKTTFGVAARKGKGVIRSDLYFHLQLSASFIQQNSLALLEEPLDLVG